MNRIKRGNPEVSAFLVVRVVGDSIYAVDQGLLLGKHGWVSSKVPKKGTDITLKVRADLLGDNFILDLKSTTGNAKSPTNAKTKVSYYNYDLSAALYLDIFSATLGKKITDFIWTMASKEYFNCKSYLASSDNILIGRAKWKKAVVRLAEGIECNWEFEDSMSILDPNMYEYEHIKESAGDLL